MTSKTQLLLGPTGLNDGMSGTLKKLHRKIKYPSTISSFFGICRNSDERESKVILEAAKEDTPSGLNNRAAALKFLRHTHFMNKRGAQSIWVCSPPKSYDKWIFDEFNGLNKGSLATKLTDSKEIFNLTHMKNMSAGTQDALKWCQKTLMVLASAAVTDKPDANARKLIKRWFADENTTDNELNTIISTLTSGFQKIRNVCNSDQLIFSDDPVDRSTQQRLWSTTYALVRRKSLSVIYMRKS
ncbi:MAG: hypothetical protein L3J28_04520 [Candidatus Polarisedimenticolaceae bacterium]|nr:hypothetical protein [Candidatus Polarisedimenticolaceae bacterium]